MFGDATLGDAKADLRHLQPRERRADNLDGKRWYQRRIIPYRTDDDRIQGVVMTMTDVTERQHAD